jgi:hypothetical protein
MTLAVLLVTTNPEKTRMPLQENKPNKSRFSPKKFIATFK